MKNYEESGATFIYTATTAVNAGDLVISQGVAGVAISDIDAGRQGVLAIEGVFRLPKKTAQAIGAGAPVYYFGGEASTDNLGALIGVCWHAAASEAGTVLVKLAGDTSASISENPYIVVRSIEDLPSPVEGKITLPNAGNIYFFTNMVDLGGLEIELGTNVLTGKSQELAGLQNCSVSITETCTVRYFRFNNVQITFNDPLGAYDWNTVNIYDSPNCITVVNADNIIFEIFGFINSYGFTITGTVNSLVLAPNCIFRSTTEPTATYFELASTAIINRRIRIQDTVFASENALQTGIKVDALATVGVESFIMKTVRFTGPGTFLDGINGDNDTASFFEAIGGNAINSTAIANMYMKNNAIPTPIAVINNRYEMEGVTEFGAIAQRFTHDVATNSIEYTSSVPRIFRIQAGYTVFSGNNNIVGVYIAINRTGGVLDPDADRISESEMYTTTSGARPDSGLAQCITTLNQGDRIYMILQNKTATTDVRVEFLNMIVEKASV